MASSSRVNNPDHTALNIDNHITLPNVTRNRRSDSPMLNLSETVPLVPYPNKASLASPDPEFDDRETVTEPYPGVDDGLFDTRPEVDILPNPNVLEAGDIPEITPRAGPEGGSDPDQIDGSKSPPNPDDDTEKPRQLPGRVPYWPNFEIGSNPDLETIPDVNVYQHKKTLAQGMMDLALFSANANQLRYVLESSAHPYFYPSVVLISISLLFQVAVGIGLIWNATYNVKDEKEICIANRINNFTVIGIFLVTVVNVFISAFGVASPQAMAAARGT